MPASGQMVRQDGKSLGPDGILGTVLYTDSVYVSFIWEKNPFCVKPLLFYSVLFSLPSNIILNGTNYQILPLNTETFGLWEQNTYWSIKQLWYLHYKGLL